MGVGVRSGNNAADSRGVGKLLQYAFLVHVLVVGAGADSQRYARFGCDMLHMVHDSRPEEAWFGHHDTDAGVFRRVGSGNCGVAGRGGLLDGANGHCATADTFEQAGSG